MKKILRHTYVHELGHALCIFAILKEKYSKKKALEIFKNLGVSIIVYTKEFRVASKRKNMPSGRTRCKRPTDAYITKEEFDIISYAGICAETKLIFSEKAGNKYLTGYFQFNSKDSDLNRVSEKTKREKAIQIEFIKKKYILDDIILKAADKCETKEPNTWINVYDLVKELL